MTTSPTLPSATSPSSIPSSSSATSDPFASMSKNFNAFLTLLTTELKYQDPTQPLNPTQFTQQLTEMTGVDQQITTNQNLQQMLTLLQGTAGSSALNYIGQTVTADGQETALANGSATWTYNLGSNAASTTLTVTDQNGNVLYSTSGDTSQGSHTFTWNGLEASGTTAPDGLYTLNITATDSNGNPVTASTTISGKVTGVQTDSGAPMLAINGQLVSASSVQSVGTGT